MQDLSRGGQLKNFNFTEQKGGLNSSLERLFSPLVDGKFGTMIDER